VADDLLQVESLVVRYGPIVAVREVSLHVEQGEIVALLGANGAGKSSFLNAVAGLVPPASGRVIFKGEEIQRLAPEQIVRRGIALTPEGRRVFPRLSVADNLRLGAVPQRDRAAVENARERVFDLFPVIRERLTQAGGTLSGGEQQMLAIGRSLMARPELLLLDEPSLGLAPILVDQIFGLLQRLREEGTTILLVEQNVHRALETADRAYVLANGAIEREGPAAELRASAEIERAYLGIGVSE
jgi:branched-chain amino acid transport system ATP-binding protein